MRICKPGNDWAATPGDCALAGSPWDGSEHNGDTVAKGMVICGATHLAIQLPQCFVTSSRMQSAYHCTHLAGLFTMRSLPLRERIALFSGFRYSISKLS